VKSTSLYSCVCLFAEASAETEPAWQNAGTSVGLQIWRIVVSYIVCRTIELASIYGVQ